MKTAKIFFVLSLIFFNSLTYSPDKINIVLKKEELFMLLRLGDFLVSLLKLNQ